jgi:uncharacterized protein (DUF433 family)
MTDTVPLTRDESGVFRVGNSRVTLDLVIRAFHRGATAEEILQDYPSLQLADVYQVIGYYLKHGSEFRAYFEEREAKEQQLVSQHLSSWSPVGLRERLLARRRDIIPQ